MTEIVTELNDCLLALPIVRAPMLVVMSRKSLKESGPPWEPILVVSSRKLRTYRRRTAMSGVYTSRGGGDRSSRFSFR